MNENGRNSHSHCILHSIFEEFMMNRRQSLSGLFALAAAASAKGGTTAWPDAVFKLGDAKTEKHPFGELTVFFDGKTADLKSLVTGTLLLYPGQEPHPPHQHPEEEIMIVTEGQGTILVGGKTHQVSNGSVMFSEANKLHGVKNTGTQPLRFYYLKWLV
jgi:quercetin dioxygenase-like cupin family protein